MIVLLYEPLQTEAAIDDYGAVVDDDGDHDAGLAVLHLLQNITDVRGHEVPRDVVKRKQSREGQLINLHTLIIQFS